jgi:phosphatidylserine decarboxylase
MNDKEGGWLCKEALARVNYDHFVCNTNEPHFGFKSWNDWFTRQLVPGARPVDGEGDPLVIVNAAESYPLTTLSLPYRNVKAVDKFWLKKNRYYTLYSDIPYTICSKRKIWG